MPGVTAPPRAPLIALPSVLRSSRSGVIRRAEAFARDGNLYIVIDVAEQDVKKVEIRVENRVLWVQEAGEGDGAAGGTGFVVPRSADFGRTTTEYYDTALVLTIPLGSDLIPEDLEELGFRVNDTSFDATPELMRALLSADTPRQIVELLQLSTADLQHLLENEHLGPGEREAADDLAHAALLRQLTTHRRPRTAVAEVY